MFCKRVCVVGEREREREREREKERGSYLEIENGREVTRESVQAEFYFLLISRLLANREKVRETEGEKPRSTV